MPRGRVCHKQKSSLWQRQHAVRIALATLDLLLLTKQPIHAISSSRDKNSCHSFAISLAWWCARCALIGYYITAPSARLPRHFVPRNDSWCDTHTRIAFLLMSFRGATNVAPWESSGAKMEYSKTRTKCEYHCDKVAISLFALAKTSLCIAHISLSLCENITPPPIRCLPIHARNYIYYINSYFSFQTN